MRPSTSFFGIVLARRSLLRFHLNIREDSFFFWKNKQAEDLAEIWDETALILFFKLNIADILTLEVF